eukprot:Protomagalhaensia_sp_Gyna_25__3537@NODE_317_length_3909_cov_32_619380_g247_i0_p2_GENE_NODE_317_length_3909_cov_32_619380_g247_i0NODE_317_length_3909_cov_32_619380_g247_i0_p2_ORF_typecomplete_len605_score82_84Pkinase/PF00069_25/3_4e47Pkinase_Tyr/PF07714_17/6_4e22Pkinase_fungal/PF17667_1/2_3e05Kinaselike/PF14531_6/86Kinaselike/PF14531_6/0_0007_NODE_317_length_3909_cov_32_619380_g247_i020213835
MMMYQSPLRFHRRDYSPPPERGRSSATDPPLRREVKRRRSTSKRSPGDRRPRRGPSPLAVNARKHHFEAGGPLYEDWRYPEWRPPDHHHYQRGEYLGGWRRTEAPADFSNSLEDRRQRGGDFRRTETSLDRRRKWSRRQDSARKDFWRKGGWNRQLQQHQWKQQQGASELGRNDRRESGAGDLPTSSNPEKRRWRLSHRPRQRSQGRQFTRSARPRRQARRSASVERPPTTTSIPRECRRESQHFKWAPGMLLRPHLRVLDQLGEGTFGRVLLCWDSQLQKEVAAKVLRATTSCGEAALCEAAILRDIMARDPGGDSGIIQIYDCFELPGGHVCLEMERLGTALYDFLLDNAFRPFLMRDIQTIARDCLKALSFLRLVAITHTDLKPENILLVTDEVDYYEREVDEYTTTLTLVYPERVNRASEAERKSFFKRPRSAHVKVVDFGSAAYDDEDHSSLINTRQYRAPEVILDIGWEPSSDLWSLGCILVELYTGQLLFQTHEHFEHLAMMERVIGRIPQHMLKMAYDGKTQGAKYTNADGILTWPPSGTSESNIKLVDSLERLEGHIGDNYMEFLDLVKSLLRIDPSKRPCPQHLMKHPFLMLDL